MLESIKLKNDRIGLRKQIVFSKAISKLLSLRTSNSFLSNKLHTLPYASKLMTRFPDKYTQQDL